MNGLISRCVVYVIVLSVCFSVADSGTRGETPVSVPGTTVISHGFCVDGELQGWAVYMAEAIRVRAGAGTIYQYNKVNGDLDLCTHPACVSPATAGESIIVFDWAEDSNQSGSGFSEAAAESLFAALVHWNPGVVNLDHLHLIGHSRGTVVVSEVAERLIAIGFPPEQVTTLDPHDAGAFGEERISWEDYDVNSEHPEYQCNPGDPPGEPVYGICSWLGVLHHDNYWRDDGWLCPPGVLDPDGREIPGSTNSSGNAIGGLVSGFCHSDPHYWYYFTINHSLDEHPDGEQQVGGDWFDTGPFDCSNMGSLNRELDGFNASRLGGGFISCPDDPSSKQEVLFDFNLGEGLVNGDFEKNHDTGFGIAGWEFHGGGGNAGIDFFLDNELDLDPGEWRRHNYFWLPVGTNYVGYCRRITDAGNGEYFSVHLMQDSGNRLIHQEPVTVTTGEWCDVFEIYPSEQGQRSRLEFRLGDNGSGVEVRVDEVRLIVESQPLFASRSGSGLGSIISTPAGISCGVDCSFDFPENTVVTLTATPVSGSTFSGWTGDCSGTGTCVVTMDQIRYVDAMFDSVEPVLTVIRAGSGIGLVTSSPSGINCGSTCSSTYAAGTQVTLQAQPLSGSSFTGWSGDGCSGTAPCVVLMTDNRNVTATFSAPSGVVGSANPPTQDIDQSITFNVTVTDGAGSPPPAGTNVTFSTTHPGWFSGTVPQGSTSPVSVGTDAGGAASVNFASSTAGSGNMTITSMGVSTLVPFQFTDPSPGYQLSLSVSYLGSAHYRARAGVFTQAGVPVSNELVQFSTTSGSLLPTSDVTSTSGYVDSTLTVGSSGEVTVTAAAVGKTVATTFNAQVGGTGPLMFPTQTLSVPGEAMGLDYSPDGTTLVANDGDHATNIRAWWTSNYSSRWTVPASDYSSGFGQLEVSPDNQHFLIVEDYGVEIRYMSNGALRCEGETADWPYLAAWRSNSQYSSLAEETYYTHSSLCADGSDSGDQPPSGEEFDDRGHLDFSPQKQLFAACSDEGTLLVWNTSGSLVQQHNVSQPNNCWDTDFSSDGSKLAVVGTLAVMVFDTTTWSSQGYTTQYLSNDRYGVAFIDNNTKLAVGATGKIEVLDLAAGTSIRTADVSGTAVEMSWNQATNDLAVGTRNGLVYVFKPLDPVCNWSPIINVTYPPNGFVTDQPQITATGSVEACANIQSFTLDGAACGLDGSNQFACPVSLVEGQNTLSFAASDAAGHTSTLDVTGTLVIDTVPPVISNASVNPPSGVTSTSFTLQATVIDGDTGVAAVSAIVRNSGGSQVGSQLILTTAGSGLFSTMFIGALPIDTYTVDITAVDSSPQANEHTEVSAAYFSIVDTPNTLPNTPTAPNPGDGLGDVGVNVVLGWTGGDPDLGDTVTYDVYLEAGDSTPDQLICDDFPMESCDPPGDLVNGQQYYWKVVAQDNHGATATGEIWDFTTVVDLTAVFSDGFESGGVDRWSNAVGYVPSIAVDLIGYYPLNGNVTDQSGNGHHGVAIGDLSYAAGIFGSAAMFDGLDDYIDIGALGPALSSIPGNVGSISFWFQASSSQSFAQLFGVSGSGSLWVDVGDVTLYSATESLTWSPAGCPIFFLGPENGHDFYLDNQWHHISVVMGSDHNALYIDGEQATGWYPGGTGGSPSTGGCMWPSTIDRAEIGKSLNNSHFFDGLIDEVRVYSRALSLSEVQLLAESDLSQGLIAYYSLDGHTNDVSGNQYHGIGVGSPSFVPGIEGQAISLDGLDDYVDIGPLGPALSSIPGNVGSISFWFQASSSQSFAELFGVSGSGSLWVDVGDVTLYSATESLTWSPADCPIFFLGPENGHDFYFDNQWHHISVVMGSDHNALYIDGEQATGWYPGGTGGSPSTGGCMWPSTIDRAEIGKSLNNSHFFDGLIDEVRVYNRALLIWEVQLLAGQ